MKDRTKDSWIKLLNPESLKSNLIKSSIYIVFYEQLKYSIIERIRDLHISGFEGDKEILDKSYTNRFKKGMDILKESLDWLIENEAITPDDKNKVLTLRKHRNEIAHEMLIFIASTEKEVDDSLLNDCYSILAKIDRWWIIEFELSINPSTMNLDPDSIDHEGIQSMNMILLQLLNYVYTGNDKELAEIYKKFLINTQETK